VWGDSWTPAPLYELLGEKSPVGSYAGWVSGQETVRLVPNGIPVSQAFDLSELPGARSRIGGAVRHSMEVIDNVHGDGELTEVPLKQTSGSVSMGTYRYNSITGQPVMITTSSKDDTPGFSFAHEVGHFIDQQQIRSNKDVSDIVSNIQEAANKTSAMNRLNQLTTLRTVPYTSNTGEVKDHYIQQNYVKYLLRENEVFARSYAQYIATESQDAQMIKDLDFNRDIAKAENSIYPSHWTDDDFAPIAKEFNNLFKAMGWLK